MEVKISNKYLIGEESGYWDYYIIAPPQNVPELTGYIMKMPKDRVEEKGKDIIFSSGNEWNPKKKEHLFMFEKETKVKGHSSKRYRYKDEELIYLYKNAESSTFAQRLEKRIEKSQNGSGKLIKATYNIYNKKDYIKESVTGWFILSDADDKWVYEITYDPLRDIGKHNRSAKGFSILEEHEIEDINLSEDVRIMLPELLKQIDYLRNLKLKTPKELYLRDASGHYIKPNSPGEAISFFALEEMIPREIREFDGDYCKVYETHEAKKLREGLYNTGAEIEKKCAAFIENYRTKQGKKINEKIKELIGIEININQGG